MQHPAAELRARRKRLVDVQRIHVARDLDEPPHVLLGEGLAERDVLPRLEVVDAGDHGGGGRKLQPATRALLLKTTSKSIGAFSYSAKMLTIRSSPCGR